MNSKEITQEIIKIQNDLQSIQHKFLDTENKLLDLLANLAYCNKNQFSNESNFDEGQNVKVDNTIPPPTCQMTNNYDPQTESINEKIAINSKISAPNLSFSKDELLSQLLAIVADKTGYPIDSIGLDMQLESELGIDSIKRVEILSGLQEAFPNLPEFDLSTLATLNTLNDIISYVDNLKKA